MSHAIYVEGHGWSGLTSKDGRETDEFDNESAVYLMSINPTHLAHYRAGALIRALPLAIAGADDRPRAIELTGAIGRLFEAAGLQVDSDLPDKRKQPGLSTGLPHQFVSNDRG